MQISLAALDFSLPDFRRIPPPPSADLALRKSIEARGVLQAILVRPFENRHQIVLGRRRARQCMELGWPEIAAEIREMSEREALEAQIIENLQRETMHPIDQWKGTRALVDAGSSIEDAAMALGLDTRAARRMVLLASLHPRVEALALTDMPSPKQLAAIAYAPGDQQVKALKAPYAVAPGGQPNWTVIANACRQTSIPRGFAIFDADTAGVVFEEDLFAEPGTPEQFVTHDIAGFLAAQTAALEKRIEAARSRGEHVQLAGWQPPHGIKTPAGMALLPGFHAATPPSEASGRVLLLAISQSAVNFGAVVEAIALVAGKDSQSVPLDPTPLEEAIASTKGGNPAQLPSLEEVVESGRRAMALRGAEPSRQQANDTARAFVGQPSSALTAAAARSSHPGDREPPIAGDSTIDSKRLAAADARLGRRIAAGPTIDPKDLTKRGRIIVGNAKTAMLREHLRNPPGAHEGLSLLTRCLLLALGGDNVHVYAGRNTRTSFHDLAEHLVDAAGDLIELPDADVLNLLGEALARMLIFTSPPYGFGSGAAAEYVGRALDVPAPRLDTADFLATLTVGPLRAASRAFDPNRSMPSSVAALRKLLIGKLPHWRPVAFGAPGPKPGRQARRVTPARR